MRNLRNITFIVLLSTITTSSFAYIWTGEIKKEPVTRATSGCEPPKTSTEFAINNVKTRIHTGGDMWWDLQGKPIYEVPANGGAHALFAGAIWIGGKDANKQLKLTAQKFRQRGLDCWPGPLITTGPEIGTISPEMCRAYDKHFSINKPMVTKFRTWRKCLDSQDCDEAKEFPDYKIPDEILNWPGNGPAGGYASVLAPFYDVNDDGIYNPYDGDFPFYEYIDEEITDDPDCLRPRNRRPKVFGDYTLWWVYNDRGNIHTETGGAPIGMEFKSQAFAFKTNDELNNMTFYNYNITNRSTYTLYDTYFGVWTDADLGNPEDDRTGCDVVRGLGYVYNGSDNDATSGGHIGYGKQPPAIGIDFFEGPYQDPTGEDKPSNWIRDPKTNIRTLICNDNHDDVVARNWGKPGDFKNGNINGLNFGDSVPDNERWGMRRFLYFNNSSRYYPLDDPATAVETYNYLTGYWKDGSRMYYGGNGHYAGGADRNREADFMFPGVTDECNWGTGGIEPLDKNWTEETANTPPRDVRFVQSAGPFTLRPGAVNDITIGAVWARAGSGGAFASVEAVQKADDKAQLLFENCFRILNGPDAPKLTIIQLDRQLIFHISNEIGSNNYLEEYAEKDPSIVCSLDIDPCDTAYRFQGYQVFQFRDESVDIADRYDNNLVREIFQCDIKDDVSKIINYTWADDLNANVPVKEVDGKNEGIQHTFVIEKDFFATDRDERLVNNKEYYYSVIAYGYNKTMLYDQSIENTFDGQKKPYLAGRENIQTYKAIPRRHNSDGTLMQSQYGTGVQITMHEGFGNGNNIIDLSQESIDKIMQGPPWHVHNERKYDLGKGPLDIKIIDPLKVPEDTYTVRFINVDIDNIYGICGSVNPARAINEGNFIPFEYEIENTKGEIVKSDIALRYQDKYEQIFSDWGFSITTHMDNFAGFANTNSFQNGFLTSSIEFEDPSKPWLWFLPDEDRRDGMYYYNWIRSGTYENKEDFGDCKADPAFNDRKINEGFVDPNKNFEKVLDGTWAPYKFVSTFRYGLAVEAAAGTSTTFQSLNMGEVLSSVDLVITKDKSKWTRSCVIETGENHWVEDVLCDQYTQKYENRNSIGGALKFGLRKSPSVDKDGTVPDSLHTGMGWFPGYAIDVRTGERLNIAFGEDSWLKSENGQDMIWNPTHGMVYWSTPIFGGKHYIYIFGNNVRSTAASAVPYDAPAYDSCKFLYEKLKQYENQSNPSITTLNQAWASAMWCAIPMTNPYFIKEYDTIADPYGFIATDVKIKIRVATHYTKAMAEDMVVPNPVNDNFPLFTFTTKDVQTMYNHRDLALSGLEEIKVVPNPYYGNSDYEREQLDNYVRVTNLPQRCDITIYNTSGTLIRFFSKGDSETFWQWDLKNSANISVSSGVYIFHIKAYDPNDSGKILGEKVVKWFGVLRPIDLNNF